MGQKKKIGGVSSRFGVGIIYGSRIAFATRLKNGEIATFSEDVSDCPKISRIPFFRSSLVFRQIILIFLLARKNLIKLAKKNLIDLQRKKRIFHTILFIMLYLGFFTFFEPLIVTFTPSVLKWTLFILALILLLRLFFYLVLGDQSLKYHGAEHKVINTFLSGDPLTLRSVQCHSRFAFRCGTTLATFFILLELLIPEKIYYFFIHLFGSTMGIFLLFFFILGLAYETLTILSRQKADKWYLWLSAPISKMQFLTTREPSLNELEVGLSAIREAIGRQQLFFYNYNELPFSDFPKVP